MVIYSTCIITTLISFVHAVYILTGQILLIAVSAVVEVSCFLPLGNI